MNRPIFPQNVIAVIWDFDKTLTPGNMQKPLFRHYDLDENAFWSEVEGLESYYRARGATLVNRDTLYISHILTYVREGRMPGLTNALLRELGGEIEFFDGMPSFMGVVGKHIESRFGEHQINVEHHVVSSGLREMILGSAVAPYIQDVWACEFAEEVAPPGYQDEAKPRLFAHDERHIRQALYTIDNTTKTRAIFEINKGTNVNPAINVNAKIAHEDRRVPFQNMIYVADGPSDVPVFSVLVQQGGRTFAVYRPASTAAFEQVDGLLEQGRIHAYGPADYTDGSQTSMWLLHSAERIAARIVRDRETALTHRLGQGQAPGHIDSDS